MNNTYIIIAIGILILSISISISISIYFMSQNSTPTPPTPTPTTLPKINNKQISGCEADEAKLVCDNNQTIKSASIIYGRWNNLICPHSTINANVPEKKKTYTLKTAINKPTFSIGAKNTHPDINEDIYPNIYKHWTIDYTCG